MQLGPAAHSDQIWACEKVGMLVMIDGKYDARLGMLRSSADGLWLSLFSCSPHRTIAPRESSEWSTFESECGTIFDALPSLIVVYDTYKLANCTRSRMGAQEAL